MLKRPAGFTLIEVLIAMAVMALLIFAATPGYREWMLNTQVRNAAESLQNGLQLARMEAIRRNRNISFWLVELNDPNTMDDSCALDSNGTSWVVSEEDPEGKCGTAPSDNVAPRIIQKHAAGDGNRNVEISATPADAFRVQFNGFGQVIYDDDNPPLEQIEITPVPSDEKSRRLRIVVTSTRTEAIPGGGHVQACDPFVEDPKDSRFCMELE